MPPTQKLQDPNSIAVFEAVLCVGIVKEDEFTNTGLKDAISQCFHKGWLHMDKIDELNGFGYCFPLHLLLDISHIRTQLVML